MSGGPGNGMPPPGREGIFVRGFDEEALGTLNLGSRRVSTVMSLRRSIISPMVTRLSSTGRGLTGCDRGNRAIDGRSCSGLGNRCSACGTSVITGRAHATGIRTLHSLLGNMNVSRGQLRAIMGACGLSRVRLSGSNGVGSSSAHARSTGAR